MIRNQSKPTLELPSIRGNNNIQQRNLIMKKNIIGHSPSNNDISGVSGLPIGNPSSQQNGGYFYQRNQSMDAGAIQPKKGALKGTMVQRKRPGMLSNQHSSGGNQNEGGNGEYSIEE